MKPQIRKDVRVLCKSPIEHTNEIIIYSDPHDLSQKAYFYYTSTEHSADYCRNSEKTVPYISYFTA